MRAKMWMAAMVGLALGAGVAAVAFSTEHVLYTFTGGNDGGWPEGALVSDSAGNFYGTTLIGGAGNAGTVFELSPSGGSGWKQSILYAFSGGDDGSEPATGLALGKDGNLYGTAVYGGVNGVGVIFTLKSTKAAWKEIVLHAFESSEGSPDGSPLVFDADGNLYGTTLEGGTNGLGTVFELPRSAKYGTYNVIYNFQGSSDGAIPYGPVAIDSAGNVYGTTSGGGLQNAGTIFEISPSNGGWTETVLHRFVSGQEGFLPTAGLIIDRKGNLFGTTQYGNTGQNGAGTVFEFSLVDGQRRLAFIQNFGLFAGDGVLPTTPVTLDRHGNVYGSTTYGGSGPCTSFVGGCGTVFELKHSSNGWAEVLTSLPGGSGGENPVAGVTLDGTGNIYGVTQLGGLVNQNCNSAGCGVVFEIPH